MQIRNILAATLLFSMSMAAVPALAATHEAVKQSTQTTLTGSTHTIVTGHKGTLTAKVTPNPHNGVVHLSYTRNGGKRTGYGSASLNSNGVVVFPKIAAEAGVYEIQAEFLGSSKYKSSTSPNWKVTVLPK